MKKKSSIWISFEISNTEHLSLTLLKKRHERKTYATQTLKMNNSCLQYYLKIINQPEPTDKKWKINKIKFRNPNFYFL